MLTLRSVLFFASRFSDAGAERVTTSRLQLLGFRVYRMTLIGIDTTPLVP